MGMSSLRLSAKCKAFRTECLLIEGVEKCPVCGCGLWDISFGDDEMILTVDKYLLKGWGGSGEYH
ncbi:MAG: hypothetical protein SVY53_01640 [Chloroflexota bacterium]|nr:hypothetical protein [Chloroflexota bacterium]